MASGGKADDTTQFFDVDGTGVNAGNDEGARTPMTEEEKEHLREELKKTDDEIATLRQVLTARLKYSNELKRKLGITPWAEVTQEVSHGLKTVKESQAYHRTEEAIRTASEAASKKLGQIRSSNTFKSFEEKVGSAYNNVKAKIVASTSIDQLAGHGQRQPNASGAGTQPTTPSTEKMGSP